MEKNFLYEWFSKRIPLKNMIEFGKKKTVPVHKYSVWYYFGGICLFLFVVQVLTGIMLLLYYRPTAESAFESVQFIVTQVKFGWLVRSIHSWAANILIAASFIHMFSVYLMKSYRPPREMTWLTGFFLLLIFLAFGFSGYLLPWNELAFFATQVGTNMAGAIPLVGGYIKTFLRGGEEVTGATLIRFFGFHVAVLPGITTVLLAIHIYLVQVHGMSAPIGIEKNKIKEEPFFPNFILKDMVGWSLVLTLLVFLSVFFPWEIGVKADPFASAPVGIKPEWYFMFMFITLKFIPGKVLFFEGEVLGIFGFIFAGIIWMLLPFFDKKAAQEKRSTFFTLIGVFVILYISVITIVGYMLPGK
ncbi:MAG: cytochrome bc complex cytochrome b subunit [Acidobacteriota bacterium]